MRFAFLTLMLASSAFGAASIKSESSYKRLVTLTADGVPAKSGVLWAVTPLDGQSEADVEWATPMKGLTVKWTGPRGRYKVAVSTVTILPDGTPDLDTAYKIVTIVGDVGPTPPGPTPPGPTPPTPPTPPAPIPTAGLRVLIVYESADLTAMPPAQQAILFSKNVRDTLNAKCVPDADGKTKAWRIYDKDVDTAGESKVWQDAMKRERKSIPWLLISNGKTGYEGPLPATADEALALVGKYATASKEKGK